MYDPELHKCGMSCNCNMQWHRDMAYPTDEPPKYVTAVDMAMNMAQLCTHITDTLHRKCPTTTNPADTFYDQPSGYSRTYTTDQANYITMAIYGYDLQLNTKVFKLFYIQSFKA